ncbi:MAG: aspartate--tRNA ligase [Candidatus Omnitrophica bacterium]|nr:aspartate--tRNA ligase [Candidatus Omnitrophota bacterium]
MYRTHTCGELTGDQLEQEVTLCGWVASRRDHGKLIFIDIRDRYGITQVLFLPKPHQEVYAKAKKLRNEDVIRVRGQVNERPKGTQNPKIVTGLVEVHARELDILSHCEDLPFPVEENAGAGEEIRLAYRYLDLRRPEVAQKFQMRHRANHALRQFLSARGFLELETPYLSKSTPEGARDFLVPARLNPGKFYALPQSPQLFKQLLMVAGMDKYYQIVRCFRDEDLRKDRQPEFTQLDLEMSFVDEAGVMGLIEEMFRTVFRDVLGKELPDPFPRISYQEAMEKYGTDKPDIGEGEFRFLWVVDFPLFEYDEDAGRWQSSHHPFTAPRESDVPLLDQDDLGRVKSRAYDLVCNGWELGSGSVRIHSRELQKKIFRLLRISEQDAEERFGFLLEGFRYGAPPHAGIAFGLDRLYAIISRSESIRDVIVFPKTQKGICLLSEGPSSVDERQLDELGIRIERGKEEKERGGRDR